MAQMVAGHHCRSKVSSNSRARMRCRCSAYWRADFYLSLVGQLDPGRIIRRGLVRGSGQADAADTPGFCEDERGVAAAPAPIAPWCAIGVGRRFGRCKWGRRSAMRQAGAAFGPHCRTPGRLPVPADLTGIFTGRAPKDQLVEMSGVMRARPVQPAGLRFSVWPSGESCVCALQTRRKTHTRSLESSPASPGNR